MIDPRDGFDDLSPSLGGDRADPEPEGRPSDGSEPGWHMDWSTDGGWEASLSATGMASLGTLFGRLGAFAESLQGLARGIDQGVPDAIASGGLAQGVEAFQQAVEQGLPEAIQSFAGLLEAVEGVMGEWAAMQDENPPEEGEPPG